ncbi:MAG: efflux RND transporter permease subunit, partial [Deltaproteobacteria bacterium]|nr:efflux RND transporter permease subunit [Deltaproteobacteria bacterium]
ERLIKYNLSIDDLLAAARRATGVRGAGFIDTVNQRLTVQTEGQSLTPGEIASTVLDYRNGAAVTLGDVANVVDAYEPPVGAAAVMGDPGVMLIVSAQYGANTLEVTGGIEKALKGLRPALDREGITLHPGLFRPANFIRTAIRNIRVSLLIGASLVVVVIILFLFNLRTAAVSVAAIPLSLLAATAVLERLGLSLNMMTLGGLAIAIGEVVDDAVIDVENIFRRLRENRMSENPRPAIRVALDASVEVRGAVVYATFAVMLVFVPVLTMSGVAGRIFGPLGDAYILAVFASLIVALTVTPAMSLVLLASGGLKEKEPPVAECLKKRYRSVLLSVERHPRSVMAGVALFTLAGIAILPFLKTSFLPELHEGHFIVHMSAVPGTSLNESMRLGRQVTLELLKVPYVRSVAQRAGWSEKADDIMGTHDSEFEVDLKPMSGRQGEAARQALMDALKGFPGVNFAVKTFLSERIEETLTGYTATFVVNIFGPDLGVLDGIAKEVAGVLAGIPGATDVKVQSPPQVPQLVVRLKKDALLRMGFAPVDVLDDVRTAYQGNTIGQVFEGNRVSGVSVILAPGDREDPAAVGELPLRNRTGTYLRLKELADIYETSGRYSVLHDGGRRVQTVTCNIRGGGIGPFTAEAKRRIRSSVASPAGTYYEFTGAAEARARSQRELIVHSLLAGIGVILMLSIALGSYRNLLLVMTNLPFALAGGVISVFAVGGEFSVGAMVGFVTLFGITLRNSIMLISHLEHLVSFEGAAWGAETAFRGASERLTPILMTALITAFGLLPLAIGRQAPGREIEGLMAVVILGGLITSTALNLLVLPTLALRYGRFGAASRENN